MRSKYKKNPNILGYTGTHISENLLINTKNRLLSQVDIQLNSGITIQKAFQRSKYIVGYYSMIIRLDKKFNVS